MPARGEFPVPVPIAYALAGLEYQKLRTLKFLNVVDVPPPPAAKSGVPSPANPLFFDRTVTIARQYWKQTKNCLREWRLRIGSRRELMALSVRELSDVHLTRADAVREARKPFWKK
jgi:uncharacterized protein YjiS (DUF1127 family)